MSVVNPRPLIEQGGFIGRSNLVSSCQIFMYVGTRALTRLSEALETVRASISTPANQAPGFHLPSAPPPGSMQDKVHHALLLLSRMSCIVLLSTSWIDNILPRLEPAEITNPWRKTVTGADVYIGEAHTRRLRSFLHW